MHRTTSVGVPIMTGGVGEKTVDVIPVVKGLMARSGNHRRLKARRVEPTIARKADDGDN